MTAQPADVFELLQRIRYDATAIQAKVTDALSMLASMDLQAPSANSCPRCGVVVRSPTSLADHLYLSHDVRTEAAA